LDDIEIGSGRAVEEMQVVIIPTIVRCSGNVHG